MEWTRQEITLLEEAVSKRYQEFRKEKKTDRKNLSELWNRHILQIGVTGIRPKKKSVLSERITVVDLIDVINFRNAEVTDALCIRNPDREGQCLLLSRDIAGKIIMLGMP